MARRTARRAQAPTFEVTRRLERIERGATVFYEVSRQDKWVMVRSGHVGLPGQTRMREYPTPASAGVAMDRLVEDRLKEGWLEAGAAEVPTPPEAPPGAPRAGTALPPPSIAPDVGPDTRTVQAAQGGPAHPRKGRTSPAPRPAAKKKGVRVRKKKG
ncbi:MAG: WGR domain-containing protein [Planctomycetes bacterium]|nr:WGR domain-containing protein [Planctomycetota bacterium]